MHGNKQDEYDVEEKDENVLIDYQVGHLRRTMCFRDQCAIALVKSCACVCSMLRVARADVGHSNGEWALDHRMDTKMFSFAALERCHS